jgi:hypothetical protein
VSAGVEPRIVVLTPVRNEAWILERFLAVASLFAHRIVIADQGSTDGSREICRGFAKVLLVDNPTQEYDEAQRQKLLIDTARATVPGRRVLLALDADEILAADALSSPGWQRLQEAEAGSILCFEKPDLCQDLQSCVRFDTPWPLGYVDDGAAHNPGPVHSIRIPTPYRAPRLAFDDVKIVHFALVRPGAQSAKMRLYSVVENLHRTSPLVRRRWVYRHDRDWTLNGRQEAMPPQWLDGWRERGIDLRTIPLTDHYWQDFEVLRHLARFGPRRFWLDDIWHFDWEACRRVAAARGEPGIPQKAIQGPPLPLRALGRLLDLAYRAWRAR